jgi:hypothetical protein
MKQNTVLESVMTILNRSEAFSAKNLNPSSVMFWLSLPFEKKAMRYICLRVEIS